MDVLDRLRLKDPSQPSNKAQKPLDKNGSVKAPAGLPAKRRPEPNRLWVLVGTVMVLGSAVATFVLVDGMQTTTSVLSAAADIREGDVFTVDNVQVLEVPPELSARALSARVVSDRPELLLGSRAPYDLPRGAILYDDLVAGIDKSATDFAIVGASLSPGQYPTSQMLVGDRVSLVRVGGAADAGRGGKFGEATIVEVQQLSGGSLLLSMEVTEVLVADLSQSLARGEVRLALIDYVLDGENERSE